MMMMINVPSGVRETNALKILASDRLKENERNEWSQDAATHFATNRPSRNDDLMIVMLSDTTMQCKEYKYVYISTSFLKAGPELPEQ